MVVTRSMRKFFILLQKVYGFSNCSRRPKLFMSKDLPSDKFSGDKSYQFLFSTKDSENQFYLVTTKDPNFRFDEINTLENPIFTLRQLERIVKFQDFFGKKLVTLINLDYLLRREGGFSAYYDGKSVVKAVTKQMKQYLTERGLLADVKTVEEINTLLPDDLEAKKSKNSEEIYYVDKINHCSTWTIPMTPDVLKATTEKKTVASTITSPAEIDKKLDDIREQIRKLKARVSVLEETEKLIRA